MIKYFTRVRFRLEDFDQGLEVNTKGEIKPAIKDELIVNSQIQDNTQTSNVKPEDISIGALDLIILYQL